MKRVKRSTGGYSNNFGADPNGPSFGGRQGEGPFAMRRGRRFGPSGYTHEGKEPERTTPPVTLSEHKKSKLLAKKGGAVKKTAKKTGGLMIVIGVGKKPAKKKGK